VEYRGRWKNSRRIIDTYVDTTINYVDAKVAQALAKGGVCVYVVEEASGISDDWICDHVVPNMMAAQDIDRQVCVVFGRALLWRVFDKSGDLAIPQRKREYILQAFADLSDRNGLGAGVNPVMVS
jgi:hypothetical protein